MEIERENDGHKTPVNKELNNQEKRRGSSNIPDGKGLYKYTINKYTNIQYT